MNDRVKIEDAVVEAVAGAMWETYQYRGKWPAMASAPEQEQFRRMATAAIAALSTPTRQAGDGCCLALVQRALDGLQIPKLSDSKTEYVTAGVRLLATALDRELRTPQPPQGGSGEVGNG
jgi:hypothetical protein